MCKGHLNDSEVFIFFLPYFIFVLFLLFFLLANASPMPVGTTNVVQSYMGLMEVKQAVGPALFRLCWNEKLS